jgi:hypothetical protein
MSVNQSNRQFELPPSIRSVLAAVRARIRAYVWAEGLAILIAVLGCAFWLGMGVDWAFEPTAGTRKIALLIIGIIVAYVAYRYVLRRVFVRISDATAAMLLERQFPSLQDHLLTAVNVAGAPPESVAYHPQLVAETGRAADEALARVEVNRIFNRGPLVRAVFTAAAFVISIIVFALVARGVFGFWLERIALSEKPWPRRVHLEVVGFPANAGGERTHKLAQDDDFELLVHARTDGYEAPDEVEIRFRLSDGRRGRDTLIRVGDAVSNQSDFQLFRYEFKHVPGDMEFDVVGGDDRVEGLHLQVVDRPELYAIELECVYPDYLKRESRRIPVTGGMRIPEGTKLVLHASSTKPLTAARVHGSKDQHETSLKLPEQAEQKLSWNYGTLTSDDVLMVSVTDADGVASREPYRVSLAAVKDEVPQVAVRLAGISSAVTPDAVLPFAGKVTDDYGLDRAWFEYQVDGAAPVEVSLATQPGGEPSVENLGVFDLRATDPKTGQRLLTLKPKQRFSLSLKATDRYDLTDQKHAGSSQQFALDIVTAADLLALLERRELSLRQRFEAIYEKLTDTRNLLSRVESDDTESGGSTDSNGAAAATGAAAASAKSGEGAASSAETVAAAAQRSLSRRRLRVAGSLQSVIQSADEVKGVAEAFDDLSQEITNNRIDNPDLQSRLGEQIARPLHQIGEQRMPELVAQLKLVEERLEDPKATAAELKKAIAQADAILVSMRQVLDKMLELETYNEVVALLRGIITDQEEINRRTKERQKDKLKSLFE